MKTLEIYFNKAGNTVVGNYSEYRKLNDAIAKKSVFVPFGYAVKADSTQDFLRLVEYVQTFGHCIKTLAGFANACKLAGVEFSKEN